MILVHFKDCWADEFDVVGFALLEEAEWKAYTHSIKNTDELYYAFGTNQCIEYDIPGELLRHYWHRPVSNDQAKVIKKMFKGVRTGYGFWPRFSMVIKKIP